MFKSFIFSMLMLFSANVFAQDKVSQIGWSWAPMKSDIIPIKDEKFRMVKLAFTMKKDTEMYIYPYVMKQNPQGDIIFNELKKGDELYNVLLFKEASQYIKVKRNQIVNLNVKVNYLSKYKNSYLEMGVFVMEKFDEASIDKLKTSKEKLAFGAAMSPGFPFVITIHPSDTYKKPVTTDIKYEGVSFKDGFAYVKLKFTNKDGNNQKFQMGGQLEVNDRFEQNFPITFEKYEGSSASNGPIDVYAFNTVNLIGRINMIDIRDVGKHTFKFGYRLIEDIDAKVKNTQKILEFPVEIKKENLITKAQADKLAKRIDDENKEAMGAYVLNNVKSDGVKNIATKKGKTEHNYLDVYNQTNVSFLATITIEENKNVEFKTSKKIFEIRKNAKTRIPYQIKALSDEEQTQGLSLNYYLYNVKNKKDKMTEVTSAVEKGDDSKADASKKMVIFVSTNKSK